MVDAKAGAVSKHVAMMSGSGSYVSHVALSIIRIDSFSFYLGIV